MEHQADVHPQLRLILPDAGPGCEKNGRRATWAVTTRSGRHQVPVAVLPTAKSLSAFSLKPQSDRLLARIHHAEVGIDRMYIWHPRIPGGQKKPFQKSEGATECECGYWPN